MTNESTSKGGLFGFFSSIFASKESGNENVAEENLSSESTVLSQTEGVKDEAVAEIEAIVATVPEMPEPEVAPISEVMPVVDAPPDVTLAQPEGEAEETPREEKNKEEEVKVMYCSKCGFDMAHGATSCLQCGHQIERAVTEPDSGIIRNYDSPYPEHVQELIHEPVQELIQEPVQESIQEPTPEQAPLEMEQPTEVQEKCTDECKEELLNFAEKKEKKASLGQEIEELRARVQPCLDELARLSACAHSDDYSGSLENIKAAYDSAKEIEVALLAKIEEYERIIINPCCEHGFQSADKHCGTCGEYLGGLGWRCGCSTLNREENSFCRGCGDAAA